MATDNLTEAKEKAWSSLDNTNTKAGYFKALTGYKGLVWEEIK